MDWLLSFVLFARSDGGCCHVCLQVLNKVGLLRLFRLTNNDRRHMLSKGRLKIDAELGPMVSELLSSRKILEITRPGAIRIFVDQPVPPLVVDVFVQH